jgi:hypothetical protein
MTQERTQHHNREVVYLMEHVGLSREEAERRLEDADLWLLDPELRYSYPPGEEEVSAWEMAADFAASLSEGFERSGVINDATRQLLREMCERADEALRRARRRGQAEAGL